MKRGWEAKRLFELCDFKNGLWKGKKEPFQQANVIRNTNFRNDGSLDETDIACIEVEAKQFDKRRLEYGDIILERSGGGPKQPVGRVITFEKRDSNFSFSNFTSVIRVKEANELDFRFLHRFLYWSYISGVTETMQKRSTGIRNLNFKEYQSLEIPLPPLEEQKRIVALLDEAFAGLASARANAEANLQNARELFDQCLSKEMMSSAENYGSTMSCKMKDVVTLHNGDRGKNYPNKSEYVEHGIPWINTGHIMPNGTLSEDRMNYITKAKYEQLGGGRTQAGDLVFCLRGATIGKTAFVGRFAPGAIASSLMIIRPGKNISAKYAYYFLTSDLGKSEILRFIGGAAQPNLAGKSVGEFNVTLPPTSEQNEITDRLDAIRKYVDGIKSNFEQKLDNIDQLKQSLLQKAFAGELT